MAHVPASDIELMQRAKEHTAAVEAILEGSEQGATAEIEKLSLEAEARLKERAEVTGSKPAGHMADVLKAQRLLVKEKDLGDRFLRISKRLEELRASELPDSEDVARLQREIEALRPLLRLSLRSEDFRSLLLSGLRIAKHVVEGQVEGDVEDVLEAGEKHGIQAATEEAKNIAQETMDKVGQKLERDEAIMSDKDWEKLSEQLDSLFRNFQSHTEFRSSVPQLFNLISTITATTHPIKPHAKYAAIEIQEEARDLIAQFSGTAQLDSLINSVYDLAKKIEFDSEVQTWWASFKELVLSSVANYKGKADIEKFRVLFRKAVPTFNQFKNEINEVIGYSNDVITNMANDELVQRLRESLSALEDDLFWTDQDGNRYFDADAAGILAQSVSDVIKTQFKYLALPKVSRVEGDTSFSLDNLVITATLPDKIDFHLESFMSLNTSDIAIPGHSALQSEIYLTATIRGITVTAPEIAFTYDSPTISESGIMSVDIPKPGANLAIDFILRPMTHPALSATNVPTPATVTTNMNKEGYIGAIGGGFMRYEFVRIKSHFAIADMDIEFDKRTLSHRLLVPFITSLFKSSIMDRFESGIEEAMDNGLIQLGHTVTGVLNQAPNPLSLSSFTSMVSAV